MFKKTQKKLKKIFDPSKNIFQKKLHFFSEMKSVTQKTPETKKYFQLVSIWSKNMQKKTDFLRFFYRSKKTR